MKDGLFIARLCFSALTLILTHNISYAMPGMHGTETGEAAEPSKASKSMGEPINSPATEIEITYSADGKTAIFVSTREDSIESPGDPLNFDIWMSHNVDGAWQEPIHLGPNIDPTVGPSINTAAWELERCTRTSKH